MVADVVLVVAFVKADSDVQSDVHPSILMRFAFASQQDGRRNEHRAMSGLCYRYSCSCSQVSALAFAILSWL